MDALCIKFTIKSCLDLIIENYKNLFSLCLPSSKRRAVDWFKAKNAGFEANSSLILTRCLTWSRELWFCVPSFTKQKQKNKGSLVRFCSNRHPPKLIRP